MGWYDCGCMEKGLTAFGINTTKDSLHILGTCPSVELALNKAIKVGQGPVGAGQKNLISSWGFVRLEGGSSPLYLILREDFIC